MEQRILVLATSGQDAQITQRLLSSVGVATAVVRDEFDLTVQLAGGAGALLVAEEALRPTPLAALRRYLDQQPSWSDLPILLIAKHGADSLEAQRAVEQLGNVTLLERPVRTSALISAVRTGLRARNRQYQVRALDQRKDEFLATLAHELRNPLSPIVNATAILERRHPDDETRRLTRMVERQVNHLTRLVDDLMDVARITSGKLQLRMAPTTAGQIVAQAVEITEQAIRTAGHTLDVHTTGADVPLVADHVRMVQTLANLLTNAAKFTPAHGRITLTAHSDAQATTLSVRDTGRGLKAETLDTIFGMFAQGSPSPEERSRGLGIGLHLSRAFVEIHGGTLVARSDGPGLGAQFIVTLPTTAVAPVALPVASDGPVADGTGLNVLVVDDNEDAAQTLAALLQACHAQVQVALDGASALAQADAQRFDAVVLDIGMPVMNGYDVARELLRRHGAACPQLIALTGWGQYTDRVLAQQAGFEHHFVKPVEISRLLTVLVADGAGLARIDLP